MAGCLENLFLIEVRQQETWCVSKRSNEMVGGLKERNKRYMQITEACSKRKTHAK